MHCDSFVREILVFTKKAHKEACGLTVVVQHQLIEVAATGFLPHILVHRVATQLIQSDAICQWLAAKTHEPQMGTKNVASIHSHFKQ